MTEMPYAMDLFCGAGGCSEGLLQAGFEIPFSSDLSPMVGETYVNRHASLGFVQGKNAWFELSDVKDLTGDGIRDAVGKLEPFARKGVPEFDLVMGGPSCQGFSRAGLRNPNDPRNMLFGEYVRVVSETRPKYVVLENVEGFVDMQFFGYVGLNGTRYEDGTTTPEILTNELNEIGYDVLPYRILDASDYGVPQRRRRVLFVAHGRNLPAPSYPKPIPSKRTTVGQALAGLGSAGGSSEYAKESERGRTPGTDGRPICEDSPKNSETVVPSDVVAKRFSLFLPGETGAKIRKRIKESGIDVSGVPALVELCSERTGRTKDEVVVELKAGGASDELVDVLLTRKRMRRRLDPNEPSPTMMSCADDFIHPTEDRPLTVREMARLQSFDDSFEFLGKRTTGGLRRRFEIPQQTQVGNAVPPLLAKAMAEEIRKVL